MNNMLHGESETVAEIQKMKVEVKVRTYLVILEIQKVKVKAQSYLVIQKIVLVRRKAENSRILKSYLQKKFRS